MKRFRIMRAIAITSVLALGGAGLAACSSSPDRTSDGAIKVTFWNSASASGATTIKKIVSEFNVAHKGKIHVESKYQGQYPEVLAKIANSVQGGHLPDAVQIADVNTVYMRDSGIALSPEDLDKKAHHHFDFNKLLPVARRYYTLNGKLTSMPFMASEPVIYANPDLIKKAGLDLNHPPKTRKEFIDWVRQLHAKTHKPGVVFNIYPWWVEQWTASDGLYMCTPRNGVGSQPADRFNLTDPQQIAAWKDLQSLYRNKDALNVGIDTTNSIVSFASGATGLLVASSAALNNISATSKFKPYVIPFPIDNREKGGVVLGGSAVWVLGKDAGGAKEQATWEFVSYLMTKKSQELVFNKTGYLPANIDALKEARKHEDHNHQVLLDQLIHNNENDVTAGCHSGALDQEHLFLQNKMQAILIGGADVETSFKAVENASKGMIRSYLKRARKTKQ